MTELDRHDISPSGQTAGTDTLAGMEPQSVQRACQELIRAEEALGVAAMAVQASSAHLRAILNSQTPEWTAGGAVLASALADYEDARKRYVPAVIRWTEVEKSVRQAAWAKLQWCADCGAHAAPWRDLYAAWICDSCHGIAEYRREMAAEDAEQPAPWEEAVPL